MGISRNTVALLRAVALGGIVGALLAAGLSPIGQTLSGASGVRSLVFTTTPGTSTSGAPLTTQPKVEIENATGNATTANTSPLTLTAETAGGQAVDLSGCSQSPTKGVVAFSGCEINSVGSFKLSASLTGFVSATSGTFEVATPTAAALVFTTTPTTITAGQTFSPAPSLKVEDSQGNVVTTTGIHIVLAVTATPDAGQGPLVCSGGETLSNVNGLAVYGLTATKGIATFTGCTIDKSSPTSYHLVGAATVGTTKGLKVVSNTFTVGTGAPSQLVFTTNPNGALLGQAFDVQPAVAVEDATGNIVSSASGTVSLSITSTTDSNGAQLQGCSSGTLSSGVVTFSGCAVNRVGTGYTLSASVQLKTDGTTLTGKSRTFAVSSGPASSITFATTPGAGTGGSPLSIQPVVTISDATGHPVSGVVSLSLETASQGATTATLSCAPNPATAGTGVAKFTNCAVDKDGSYRLVATDLDVNGGLQVVSTPFTVTTGPAAQVVFTRSPSSSTGGAAFPTQPIVSVEDLGGNPVLGATITLGIAPGTGTAGAALTCSADATDTVVASAGSATFTGCGIDRVGSGYQLIATSAGITGKSASFTVALGPPEKLEFSAEPSGGTVSTPLGGQPQVSVTDAGGNPVDDSGISVDLGASSGSLSCLANPVATDASGVAVFVGCKTGSTGAFHLQATAPRSGLAAATSTTFTVVPGTPLAVSPQGVPTAQTYGGPTLGANPTSIVDDVNSATGALDLQYSDLTMAAVGEPLTLTRTYNSNDVTSGAFGPGWSSILDAGVRVNGLTAVVPAIDGQQLVFTSNGTGGWNPPAGAKASLSCQGTLCTVTQFDGTVFQSVGGQIQDYLSPDGIGLHFLYSGGHLTKITGSAKTLLTGVEASLHQQVGTLSPTSTPSVLGALERAIAAIGQALTPACWVDGNDLSPSLGSQVFVGARKAATDLLQLATPAPHTHQTHPSISTVPGWDAAAVLDIGQALRIVDANALSENISDPRHAPVLGAAEKHFATGDSRIASGKYPPALAAYEAAWTQALGAQGTGQGSRTPLEISVQENATGEVTSIRTPTRTVSYGYTTALHLLTSYTDPDGNTWTYSYTSGALTQVTDPTGITRLSVTYAGGRVASASGTGSQTTHFVDTYAWNPTLQTSTRSSIVQLSQDASPTVSQSIDEYAHNVLLAHQSADGATDSYSYDANLDLTGIQDPLGQVQRMSYSSAGDLLAQSSPADVGNAVVSFSYNGDHQMLSEQDANGNTTTYAYTGANLVGVTPPGPASGATRYRFNYLGEQYETDGPTETETFTYDAAGNQTGLQSLDLQGNPLDGRGPVYSYDEEGQKTVLTDPRGHTATGLTPAYQTVNTYNGEGQLLSTTSPGQQTTTTAYRPDGAIDSVTEPTGATTTYSWNESTLQYTSSGPAGTTASTYDPSGDLLVQTGAGGATTTYTYDTTGRKVSETGPTGITQDFRYDLESNVIASSSSSGFSSTYTYDAANQNVASTVNGLTTSTAYDRAGNVITQTDGDGQVTRFAYNSHELLASVTTTAGTTKYSYNLANNLIAVTDGNGHTTAYQVNGIGERTQMTVNGNATTYTYDVAGNLLSTTDPDGRTTRYTLNAEDERTGIAYTQPTHPSIDISQTFNAAGKRTSVTDPTTGKTSYSYNPAGDLTSATTGSDTYTYSYSTPGKMVETYPDGTQVTYSYDDAHALMSVSTTTGINVSYERNAARQVTGIAYSNGVLQSQSYNQAGLVTSMSLTCGGTTELTHAATFDAAGNPLGEATTAGATTTTESYAYDGSARTSAQATTTTPAAHPLPDSGCTSGTGSPSTTAPGTSTTSTTDFTTPTTASQPVVPTEGAPSTATRTGIGYDAVGNITSIRGISISYNAADQVVSETGPGHASYTYDRNGDVTSKTVGGVTTTYSYNAADQLEAVTTGGTKVTYAYDGDGNRVSRTIGGTVTDYSWDPSGPLPLLALICSGNCDTRSHVVDRFIYGVGPVAMQTETGTYYLHQDQQGDVIAVSNAKGKVVEAYSYDALGDVTARHVGSTPAPAEPLLFQGQYLDTATGLYDMRARNYDPSSGTFTQRDPVATPVGTPVLSPYSYADDVAPVMADPSGDAALSSLLSLEGHSTETSDIAEAVSQTKALFLQAPINVYKFVRGAKLASAAAKVAPKAAQGAKYAVTEVRAAAPLLGKVSGAVADLSAEASVAASEGGQGAGAAADSGVSLIDALGVGLVIGGIALSIYMTVETCEHGSVQRCVGQAVSTVISVGCLYLMAVGTWGLGVGFCVMASVGLGLLIEYEGPQIVAALAPLWEGVAEGVTSAYSAIAKAFNEAGGALTGAYEVVATAVSTGFTDAIAGLTSFYTASVGVITTGFNNLAAYVSSGFESVLSTLEGAGESALDLAETLKNQFGEDLHTALNELISLGYDVEGIAKAIEDAFGDTAATAAAILKGFEYSVDEIAAGLRSAFTEGAAAVAQILQGLGITVNQITTALKVVFTQLATGVAKILKGLGYSVATVAKALASVGITPTQIAAALRTVFQTSAATLVRIFRTTLGKALQTAATALENIYGETASGVTTVLKSLGITIKTIEGVLADVFHLTFTSIVGTLQAFFSTATIASIGGAFSNVGQFFTTTVGNFFTNTLGF